MQNHFRKIWNNYKEIPNNHKKKNTKQPQKLKNAREETAITKCRTTTIKRHKMTRCKRRNGKSKKMWNIGHRVLVVVEWHQRIDLAFSPALMTSKQTPPADEGHKIWLKALGNGPSLKTQDKSLRGRILMGLCHYFLIFQRLNYEFINHKKKCRRNKDYLNPNLWPHNFFNKNWLKTVWSGAESSYNLEHRCFKSW